MDTLLRGIETVVLEKNSLKIGISGEQKKSQELSKVVFRLVTVRWDVFDGQDGRKNETGGVEEG